MSTLLRKYAFNGQDLPYEAKVTVRDGVRARTPHVDINGNIIYNETLEDSHTKIMVSLRSTPDNQALMRSYYNLPAGTITCIEYDPNDQSNPSKTRTFTGGALLSLPDAEDRELAEYEFSFAPITL